jgi:glycine/D-amino acid oxidase-like deaminating enzyme
VDIADCEHISAGTVILAAGVWTAALAETAALEVRFRHSASRSCSSAPAAPMAAALPLLRSDRSAVLPAGKLDHRLPVLADPRSTTSYAGCDDKVSPAVGRLAADLLLGGISSDRAVDGRDFRLERFAEGKPLTSASPYVGAGEMR